MIFLKILLVTAIVFVILFVLSLVIYFFNLDMKAAALIMPLFEKHYDRVDRKKERQKAKEAREAGEQRKAEERQEAKEQRKTVEGQEAKEQQKNGEQQDDAAI